MTHVRLLREGLDLHSFGGRSVIAGLAAILVSVNEASQIFSTLRLAGKEISKTRSWFSVIGGFQTLFTPAFLFLAIAGCTALICKKRIRPAVLLAVGILPTLPYLVSREPKMILPALPGLLLGVAHGFDIIFWSKLPSRPMTALDCSFGC